MKSYRRKDYDNICSNAFHKFAIRFLTDKAIGQTNVMQFNAMSIEDAVQQFNEEVDVAFPNQKVIEVVSVLCDGKPLPKRIVDAAVVSVVFECDGGGAAAGGDAGGASAGGDAGAIDAGDIAGEMAGTSTTDVLGTFDPKKGVMGVGNFMVPSKVKVPLHRWEVCNGGSKRKKDKKGRDKKYAYEKGMKVVVSMFEKDGAEQSGAKLDQSKVLSHLKKISKGVKSMDDVKAVEAKIEKEKSKIESRFSKSSYSQIKQMFTDFYAFIKDICTGKYKASWFAVTMVTVGLIYIISPIDLIPDVVPVIGVIDDAFVLKLIYDVVKDEIGNWKSQKTVNGNRASMH